MALCKYGALLTEFRGSIGGTIFSRNHYCSTARNRTKNNFTKPQTKLFRINLFAYLTYYWNYVCTDLQRIGWQAYAAATPLINRLGDTYYMTGFNAFIRTNMSSYSIGRGYLASAPATPGFTPVGTVLPANIIIDVSSNNVQIAEAAMASWSKSVNNDSIVIFQCPACFIGKNFLFFKERFLGYFTGNLGAPPAFPQIFTSMWPLYTPARVGLIFRRLDPFGKYSGKTAVVCSTQA
jgi:hypothetical protein